MSGEARSGPSPTAVLTVAIAAAFMAILAASSVNIALPAIGRSWSIGMTRLHWIVTTYMIAFTVAIPLTGWLGDRFGPRRVLTASIALFGIASVVAATAPSFAWLLVGRVLQGAGASAVMPTSMILITRAFPSDRRGRALGIWAVGAVTGPALGPTIGGLLVDQLSWRWVFWINVPAAALVVLLALVALPAEDGRGRSSTRVDAPALFLLGTGITAMVVLLSPRLEGGVGGFSWPVLAVGAAALVAFAVRQRRSAEPVFPRALTGRWVVRSALALTLVRSLGLFGPIFLLPIMLQDVLDMSPVDAGLVLTVGAVAIAVTSPIAGRLVDTRGPRLPALLGAGLIIIGLGAYHDLGPGSSIWAIGWPMVVRGAGIALLMNAVSVTVLNSTGQDNAGRGASLIALMNQLTGLVAVASLNAIVDAGLAPGGGAEQAAHAFDVAFVVAAVSCAVVAPFALGLPSGPPEKKSLEPPAVDAATGGLG